MPSDPISVRPTKRCIDDLEVDLPYLGVPLNEIAHPVVTSAQSLPEQTRLSVAVAGLAE